MKAYLARMTSRLLLTLLALLTGLSAQAAPADARAHPERAAEMSTVAAFAGEALQSIPAGFATVQPRIRNLQLAAQGNGAVSVAVAVIPAVLAGIDRARE